MYAQAGRKNPKTGFNIQTKKCCLYVMQSLHLSTGEKSWKKAPKDLSRLEK